MSPLERVNSRESMVRSHGGALLVADCKDCQATQAKGAFSACNWRISWLTRVVFPIPGNPTIEMAMGTPQGGHGGTAPTYPVGGGIFLDAKAHLPKRLDC